MIEYEKVISMLIQEGKSLTRSEREKAAGPYDEIYFKDKIRHHARRVRLLRAIVFLVYFTLLLSVYYIFFFSSEGREDVRLGLQIILVILIVLSLIGLPYLFMNHGRNASVLRMIRRLRQEQAKSSAENAAILNLDASQLEVASAPENS